MPEPLTSGPATGAVAARGGARQGAPCMRKGEATEMMGVGNKRLEKSTNRRCSPQLTLVDSGVVDDHAIFGRFLFDAILILWVRRRQET